MYIFLFYFRWLVFYIVMAELDPAIHVVGQADFTAKQGSGGAAWMPGSSPGMTEWKSNPMISEEENRYVHSLARRREGRT
ncbi:MAG: hypothetical protein JWO51_2091 [Rhodospirillales bacterium]|nr:hypothetical protein [Rhodospirillales bacterium]